MTKAKCGVIYAGIGEENDAINHIIEDSLRAQDDSEARREVWEAIISLPQEIALQTINQAVYDSKIHPETAELLAKEYMRWH